MRQMKKAMRLSDIQDQDFIPILTEEDETAMQEKEVPEVLPLLSLRNTVLFPGVVIPCLLYTSPSPRDRG